MNRAAALAAVAAAVVTAAIVLPAGCGRRASGPPARVRVTDAWARASAGAATAGAVYVTLESPAADRLVGVGVPPSVARFAQMHETARARGAGGARELGMRRAAAVELPAGERVAFAPGRRHIMLLELAHPLAAGDTIPMALAFERARAETVRVPVRDE